jgi:hypothetical protein
VIGDEEVGAGIDYVREGVTGVGKHRNAAMRIKSLDQMAEDE